FGVWFFFLKEPKSCMAWMGEKYEEVPCNWEFKDQKGINIQINNGDINIVNFKQLHPDQHTVFYDETGNPKVWYANNTEGQPEYFNDSGYHPITKETLKPVPLKLVE